MGESVEEERLDPGNMMGGLFQIYRDNSPSCKRVLSIRYLTYIQVAGWIQFRNNIGDLGTVLVRR
jgi:hypothetical protein